MASNVCKHVRIVACDLRQASAAPRKALAVKAVRLVQDLLLGDLKLVDVLLIQMLGRSDEDIDMRAHLMDLLHSPTDPRRPVGLLVEGVRSSGGVQRSISPCKAPLCALPIILAVAQAPRLATWGGRDPGDDELATRAHQPVVVDSVHDLRAASFRSRCQPQGQMVEVMKVNDVRLHSVDDTAKGVVNGVCQEAVVGSFSGVVHKRHLQIAIQRIASLPHAEVGAVRIMLSSEDVDVGTLLRAKQLQGKGLRVHLAASVEVRRKSMIHHQHTRRRNAILVATRFAARDCKRCRCCRKATLGQAAVISRWGCS
eukprot:scaffold742_cov263-Pinguiococcus_pyrenoidosus.AAC.12